MLTSMNNNNSLIFKSKSKEKIINNNKIKKPIFKNNKTNNSLHGLNNLNYNFNINKKNINSNFFNNNNHKENNITNNIKFNNKDNKKYSMTSVSSRKISKEREKPKKPEKPSSINNINKISKPQDKINFNGLLNNYNFINNKQYLTKNVNNNTNKYINNNIIINENNYIKNNNNSNNNSNINNINSNGTKKLFMVDFNNLKKGKLLNDFLETYLKSSQTSNNKKIKPNINSTNNYINSNNYNYIPSTKNSHKNLSSTANTSLVKTNNFFQSSSPNSGNDFFKTAKISPRSSFPKKNQDIIQSHRVNVKNKLQGNIFSFYDNCKNKENNNIYGNNSNTNLGNYSHNITSHLNKKKKINMSVNMNITYNNKNFNMSNINKSKNRSMINNEDIIDNNIKFNLDKATKSNSINKIKNINIIENYNYDYNLINKNDTNTHYNNHNSSNSSFINIRKSQNPIIGGNNIINNCKININNINYNNYNNTNNNQIINAKIIQIDENKPSNKIYSSSQQELTQLKKTKNKNFTMNNSPNKNMNIKYKISNNNSQIDIKINSNINSFLNKNNNKSSNNSLKSKENKKINYQLKEKEKANNNSLLFNDKIDEILELKQNLQKNNSELYVKSKKESKDKHKKIEKEKDIINYNKNTISNLSSTTHDANYYMEKCISLSKYIKEYYHHYNKYPNTNLNFYLYGRLIGQGAFGKVNIGLNILTGRVVAIKSFNKKSLSANGDNMKKILSETDLMKKLNHPNVTKILEMFEDDGYILIAMEYINGGNLFSFVKKRRKLSEKTAKFLFRQIILGIKHIHSKKIVHRDIKLENILIDLNNNIKICDFGIGRILKSEKQMLYDKCGTPMYMAPEILLSSKTKGYEGFPVDIWSSGISLYIMLSGTLPFNLKNKESSESNESNNNNIELQYSIINKEPKKIEKISDEARDLLKGLLNKNPKKRLTIEQILNHPWLMEGELKNKKNKKYHLFTKAEMIMLSKTYIDYRNSLIDDLKENFTISNLKMENNKALDKNKKLKNITTKSSLLAPYNTLIQNEESISEDNVISQDEFDDLANPNIILENDILIVNNKIKEFNLNYELNNNGECDHGMLINTKTETISSSITNNQSQISSRNENDDELDDNSDNEENEEEQEKKTEKILEEIERLGYERKYVINTVKNNELCHASAIFYLMMNYKDI